MPTSLLFWLELAPLCKQVREQEQTSHSIFPIFQTTTKQTLTTNTSVGYSILSRSDTSGLCLADTIRNSQVNLDGSGGCEFLDEHLIIVCPKLDWHGHEENNGREARTRAMRQNNHTNHNKTTKPKTSQKKVQETPTNTTWKITC